MLLIPCPWCGPRPEIEFRCCGEAHIARPAAGSQISDEAFERYLYIRSNPKGLHYERWRHVYGCARFFNVARNTVSDRIETSYETGQPPPPLGDERSAS
jgi:sarcosine oxidase, subunit delta